MRSISNQKIMHRHLQSPSFHRLGSCNLGKWYLEDARTSSSAPSDYAVSASCVTCD